MTIEFPTKIKPSTMITNKKIIKRFCKSKSQHNTKRTQSDLLLHASNHTGVLKINNNNNKRTQQNTSIPKGRISDHVDKRKMKSWFKKLCKGLASHPTNSSKED
ncbi:uncharacterized protein MELLADRAFT_61893 [Melampsora larici-populina 98AG31]|uniref:Uncharacterized protein n=1 Tax=Melampsora larici-populina (strain 98AG31 / pathotype 3-4-7) TaxID=747676 RepID=F4RGQ1_MELLP|nr:uncharacterized protein MELLADRAFT_61893 [Melampsora larici-populina 98AG31]EGG08572.1 hypothetical protein MELLADRAFT_61893 [Melampsora larici-populina 98AG31]